MIKLFVTLSTAVLLVFASTATAAPPRREAYSVRIDGYVGAKPVGVPLEVSWTVSVKGEMYDLHVDKLVVLTGNIAYYDIITALRPYQPALTVTGSDEQIDRFATAPTNQKISVNGFLQLGGGARYLMISNVDYVGEPQQTPANEGETKQVPSVSDDEPAHDIFP